MQLAEELLGRRGDKTLSEFAGLAHYSIAALSNATSGQSIPTVQLLTAYAGACTDSAEEFHQLKERWLALRLAAIEEREAERKAAVEAVAAAVDAVWSASPHPGDEGSTRPSQRGSEPGCSLRVSLMLPMRRGMKTREQDVLSDVSDGPSPNLESRGALEPLVREAVEAAELAGRNSVALHLDPVHGALSLCTVPGDLMELLRDQVKRSEVTTRHLEYRVRHLGVTASTVLLHNLLQNDQLPPARVLAAILACCGVPRAEIDVWLYHRARIEIASVRHAVADVSSSRLRNSFDVVKEVSARRARSGLQMILLVATLLAAAVQLSQLWRRF